MMQQSYGMYVMCVLYMNLVSEVTPTNIQIDERWYLTK